MVWVRELEVYGENDQMCYRHEQAIIKSLLRKIVKGTYNPALAVKAWEYYAETVRQGYRREYGAFAGAAEKRALAVMTARHFEDVVRTGEYVPADYGLKGELQINF
jgi:hypothetical protein